ncbi:hypothetical protein [Anaerofustis sp.]|uniref:hypothetical protein n=1 Tax=Anaerofustis sp. TaxID=1872517 RepID=UPI0025C1845F|nr:hypothetical protein [Anaerofustis sp.]
MVNEIIELMEEFLDGNYMVDDFKTDISVIVDMEYDELTKENEDIAKLISEDLLDILNEHEDGSCIMTLMEKVNDVYEKIRNLI